MLFLAGIEYMETEEQRLLLAQLQSINSLLLLKNGAMEGAFKAKKWIARKSADVATMIGKEEWKEQIESLDRKTDWEANALKRAIDENIQEVQKLSEIEVWPYLKEDIANLVNLPRSSNNDEISQRYLERIAKQQKIFSWQTMDTGILEEKLYLNCLEEQINLIKEHIKKLSPEEEYEIREILQKEIDSLSQSDQEAMRKAANLDVLSATAVMTLIKTSSAVGIAQLLIASSGFGAYLFLTTMIKALSLFMGITFSFGVYTGATAGLAFLLSPFFLLFIILSSGGLILWHTNNRLNDYLIKAVFLAGKAKLASRQE
jgi:hypothetical protein